MRLRQFLILVSVALAVVTGGCNPAGESQSRRLMVSVEPQRYLLERIAGPKWSVTSLLARGEDPESFDPSISDLRRLHDAEAYFEVGTLDFEKRIVRQSESGVRVYDTSSSVVLLEGTHEACGDRHDACEVGGYHSHPTDPHTWASLRNLKIMAAGMLEAMVELDPADSLIYRRNYDRLVTHLDSCDRAAADALRPCARPVFMIWHPSLSYFARDYGLEQLSVGMENKELSVTDFRRKIDQARSRGASVFLVQPDFDAGRSAAVAEQAGVGNSRVNTLVYDLPAELVRVAKIIGKQ